MDDLKICEVLSSIQIVTLRWHQLHTRQRAIQRHVPLIVLAIDAIGPTYPYRDSLSQRSRFWAQVLLAASSSFPAPHSDRYVAQYRIRLAQGFYVIL
jgi:hypothetical protein